MNLFFLIMILYIGNTKIPDVRCQRKIARIRCRQFSQEKTNSILNRKHTIVKVRNIFYASLRSQRNNTFDRALCQLVSWCFEPRQPERIIPWLKTNFSLSPRYSVHKSLDYKFFSNHYSLSNITQRNQFSWTPHSQMNNIISSEWSNIFHGILHSRRYNWIFSTKYANNILHWTDHSKRIDE